MMPVLSTRRVSAADLLASTDDQEWPGHVLQVTGPVGLGPPLAHGR
jgi:hypothetical protein